MKVIIIGGGAETAFFGNGKKVSEDSDFHVFSSFLFSKARLKTLFLSKNRFQPRSKSTYASAVLTILNSFAKIKHKCPSALSPVFQKSGWIYLSKIHPLCFVLFFLRNLDSARIHLMTVYGCIPCHDTGIRIQIIFLTILREPAGLHLTVVRQIIPFFSAPVP